MLALVLAAQVPAGPITGIVTDQNGSAAPGVTVVVTQVATGRPFVIVTSADGVYTAPSLPPGEYRLEVTLKGFTPIRREGVRLSTGEKVLLDLRLGVGDVREQITVQADSPMLRSEAANLGTLVPNRHVVNLPLNGRTFVT